MSTDLKNELLIILKEARGWVSRPGNDFSWSNWENAADALKELDDLEKRIREDGLWKPMDYSILFSPTGDLQEVSLSSGWGNEFLELADRADQAILKFKNR